MKDRYLYKAKTCNGEWVAGFLHCKDDKWYISNKAGSPFAFEVRPDTICQCTGLKDKNGKLIWENDILNLDEGINAGCFWDEINLEWGVRTLTRTISLCCYSLAELAVIGNIFDNSELLESKG